MTDYTPYTPFQTIRRLRSVLAMVGAMVWALGSLFAQTLNDYRSNATGTWGTAATWQRYNGSAWVTATAAPTASGANTITVRSPHTVTVSATTNADQLTVEAGATLSVGGVAFTVANGSGTDLTVGGTVTTSTSSSSSVTIASGSTAQFLAGSVYVHGRNSGTVPAATWDPASTVRFTGMTAGNGYPSGMAQQFGNVTFASSTSNTIGISTAFTITGTLTFSNTGSGSLVFNNSNNARVNTIGGDLVITSGIVFIANSNGTTRVNVAGNYLQSGGQVDMNDGNGGGTLAIGGNFTFTGGTITETGSNANAVLFNGAGQPQVMTIGGSITGTVNFTVAASAFLQMAADSDVITGTGAFTLSDSARLGIRSAEGIAITGAVGHIRSTGTRTFHAGAHYVYNGSVGQNTGTGLPTAMTGSLTIDNPAGVTIVADARSITTGSLHLVNGTFNADNSGPQLSLGTASEDAVIERSAGAFTGTILGTGHYTVVYSGSSKSSGGEVSGEGLQEVTLNLDEGADLTLTADVTVQRSLTLSSGILNTGANVLTVSSMVTTAIVGGSSGSFIVGRLRRGIAAGIGTYEFPFGTGTIYAPATLTFGASTASGLAEGSTVTSEQPQLGTSTLDPDRSVNRYYRFTAVSGLTVVSYQALLHWTAADQDAGFDPSTAAVGLFASSTWSYPVVVSQSGSHIQTGSMSQFGDLAVANEARVLSLNAPQDIFIGQRASYIVTRKTKGGTELTAGSITVTLSASGSSGEFYAVPTAGSPVTTVTIPDGASTTAFYFTATSADIYTVTVQSAGYSDGSDQLTVLVQTATKLGFVQQPTNATAGGTISPAIVIEALDGNEQRVTQYSGTATISIASGPSGSVITGTAQAVFSNGIASFSSVVLRTAGTYSLTVQSGALPSITSVDFQIVPAAADVTTSSVTADPAVIQANGTSTAAIAVQLKDAYGNLLTLSGGTVVVTATSGTMGPVADNGDGTYTSVLTSATVTGTSVIAGTLNGAAFTDTATVQFVLGAVGTYRSKTTGTWTTNSTWERFDGTDWQNANTTPTAANADEIIIRSPHVITVTQSVTVDQLTVEAGGQVSINPGITMGIADGIGDDITIYGTVSNSGTVNRTGTISAKDGSVYIHAVNGGSIPIVQWDPGSTLRVTGTVSTPVSSGLDQNFANVTFAVPLTIQNIGIGSSLTVNGDLRMENSGTFALRLATGSTERVAWVGGDLIISSGTFVVSNGANGSIRVLGDITVDGGTLDLSSGSGVGTLTSEGDITIVGGTITETATGSGMIVIDGTGTPQVFSAGGGIINSVHVNVLDGAFFQMAGAATVLTGSGTFQLASGATLGVRSEDGISVNSDAGAIRMTGGRLFADGSRLVYNGSGPQSTGNGAAAAVFGSLTIDNPFQTVTASVPITVSGTLTVRSGSTLHMPAYALTIGALSGGADDGTISLDTAPFTVGGNGSTLPAFGGTIIGSGSLVKIGGGALIFSNGPVSLSDLTINAGSVTAPAGVLSLSGNFVNRAVFSANSGTVRFTGSAQQTIGGTNGVSLHHSEFLNPAGTVIMVPVVSSGTMALMSGGIAELDAAGNLLIDASGSITTDGASLLRLRSGASYRNLSSGTPRMTVERLITGTKGWRQIASPVRSTFEDLTGGLVTQGFSGSMHPTLQPNLLWWNDTTAGTANMSWRQPAAITDSVVPGRGYFQYIFNGAQRPDAAVAYTDTLPVTIDVTGAERSIADGFAFPLSYNPHTATEQTPGDTLFLDIDENAGWNLIGNPTPSSLDWDASQGWLRNNLDGTFYVWDPSANGGTGMYRTWNGTTGTLPNGTIAPFQALWVKANASEPSLSFTNAVKTSGASFLGKVGADSAITGAVLRLALSAEGMKSESLIDFSPDGSIGYDRGDAFQLVPMSDTYLINATAVKAGSPSMIIQHLPVEGYRDPFILPLYTGLVKNGQPISSSFTLQWELTGVIPENWQIVLFDDTDRRSYSLSQNGSLAFQYNTPSSFLSPVEKINRNGSLEAHGVSAPTVVRIRSVGALGKGNSAQNRFRIGVFPDHRTGEVSYLPMEPTLEQNFPNPFNPSTTVRFMLPDKQRVRVEVYDLLGRSVAVLADGVFPYGTHAVPWNAAGASSGIYVCRMTAGTTMKSMKMILLR